MVCLDSDIIINILRNKEETINLIKELKEKNYNFTTTAINAFELWKGIYGAGRKNEEKSLIKFLEKLKTLPLEEKASRKSAEIYERLKKEGNTLDLLDIMIASIAIINDDQLLTFNKNHFERIKELDLFDISNIAGN